MRGENFNQTFRARELRGNATPEEKLLWKRMSNRQIGGYKFVRQAPIRRYFVDYVCREKYLVIEIDGATNSTESERAYDAHRSAFLQTQGYSVLRFFNDEVFKNIKGVLETIFIALLSMPLTPTLSPQAGRGGAYEINPLTLCGKREPNGLGDNHGSY
jgi:very-short-patch-repair endonuclease